MPGFFSIYSIYKKIMYAVICAQIFLYKQYSISPSWMFIALCCSGPLLYSVHHSGDRLNQTIFSCSILYSVGCSETWEI
jgi:hypothetical protein